MEKPLLDIFEKCNNAYSNGEFYTLTQEENNYLVNELKLTFENPEITDELYDILYFTAKQLFPEDSYFKQLTSTNAGYGEEIIHDFPMGSMDELKEGDFAKWKIGHTQFMLSDKLDGCSIILKYKEGKLFSAATRGRGIKGKDIMRHVKIIKSIPKTIKYTEELIVRGELLYTKSLIDWTIKEIELNTGKKFKNGRNTVAGLLNSKDTSFYLTDVDFVTYWTNIYESNSFDFLKTLGFKIPYTHILYDTKEEPLKDEFLINCVKTRLQNSIYELDGIILTQLDNIEEGFETGTINPKASRKFKIGIYDNIAESIITNIKWQISRWGVFTPVLEIEPREVSGCTVTNITGHNYKNLLDKNCGIGSKIKFSRAGLVIPYLMQVLTPSNNLNLPNIKTKIKGVDLCLDNFDINDYTIEMNIQQLVYFGKKLEIDMMGYGNCKKIYLECLKDGIELDPLGFCGLPEGLITEIIGKNGEKLEASLKAKKSTSTEVLLAAASSSFGPGIGESILNLVYNKYNTLEVTEKQLSELDNFGDSRILQYLEWVNYWPKTKEFFEKCGFVFKQKNTETKLKNYIVCFSGVRDKAFSKYIEENGGISTDSWKKTVTHLVVKDKNNNSSKIEKAKQQNIPILTLEEGYTLLGYKNV